MKEEPGSTSVYVSLPRWPAWTPSDLIAAYDAVRTTQRNSWEQPEELKELNFGAASFGPDDNVWLPLQYLLGIGSQANCLTVLERLGTDLRMRGVWERLAKLTEEVRSGKLSSLLYPDRDLVACRIARTCIQCLDNATQPPSVTRQSWGCRHRQIAATAKRLAQLLSAGPCMDEGFSDARFLFSEAEKHGLATHLYYSAIKQWDEETYRLDGSDALPPEPSQQEVDADEKEIGILQYWLDDALRREAPSPSQIIERFATSAEMVAKNPPFVSTGDAARRYVFLLSGSLVVIFDRWFRSPLDEIVAAIATVTSSEDVSADAVKMRRNRWRKHYARPRGR